MLLAAALFLSLLLGLAALPWAVVAGRFLTGGLGLIASQEIWLFLASSFFPYPRVELMLAFGVWFFVDSVLVMAGGIIGIARRLLVDGQGACVRPRFVIAASLPLVQVAHR